MDYRPVHPIGYYVHHHGTGHLRRALNIIKHISRPVVIFSELLPPDDLPKNATYVQLPSDAIPGYQQPSDSVFHYTPYGKATFQRNRLLVDSWQTMKIQQLYVDVSIEVAVLAKLHGLTVGHNVMHGVRIDQPHSYGYDACDYLLACMAPEFDIPTNRTTSTQTIYSGGISRFEKRPPQPLQTCRNVAVLLSPKAEQTVQNDLIRLAKQTPDITWHCIGFTTNRPLTNVVPHGSIDDPLPLLQTADVIIGAGGNNTIMELASLGKPFICIPESRPYDEQLTAAKQLDSLQAAIHLDHFPTPSNWHSTLEAVHQLDLKAFNALVSDNAAQVAASVIESAGK